MAASRTPVPGLRTRADGLQDDPEPDEQVTRRVTAWLDQAIIGLSLCPFAAVPRREGRVRVAVSRAASLEAAVHDALEAAWRLLDAPGRSSGSAPGASADDTSDEAPKPETTLLAFPDTASDFEELLDVAATVEDVLDQAGGAGMLQVITFHPDYRFEGEDPDDPGVWTNRSPVPLLHLLREDEVSRAVDTHPDTLGIPERNVRVLRELGLARLRAMWEGFGR